MTTNCATIIRSKFRSSANSSFFSLLLQEVGGINRIRSHCRTCNLQREGKSQFRPVKTILSHSCYSWPSPSQLNSSSLELREKKEARRQVRCKTLSGLAAITEEQPFLIRSAQYPSQKARSQYSRKTPTMNFRGLFLVSLLLVAACAAQTDPAPGGDNATEPQTGSTMSGAGIDTETTQGIGDGDEATTQKTHEGGEDATTTEGGKEGSGTTLAPMADNSTTTQASNSSSTTTSPASSSSTTTTTTAAPGDNSTTTSAPASSSSTTAVPAPAPRGSGGFSGWSFFGGIVLTVVFFAIGFVGFKYYKVRRGQVGGNYDRF